jgi:hypothetical protein
MRSSFHQQLYNLESEEKKEDLKFIKRVAPSKRTRKSYIKRLLYTYQVRFLYYSFRGNKDKCNKFISYSDDVDAIHYEYY